MEKSPQLINRRTRPNYQPTRASRNPGEVICMHGILEIRRVPTDMNDYY